MAAETAPTFDESCHRFREFLANNGWHPEIAWLRPEDLILTGRRLFYIKSPVSADNLQHYRSQFELGLARGLGILVQAICESGNKTFCYIWIPADKTESQYHLMPSETNPVKMCVPVITEDTKFVVEEVQNRFLWKYLQIRYKNKQELKNSLFC